MKTLITFVFAFAILIVSCKKEDVSPTGFEVTVVGRDDGIVRDSAEVILYKTLDDFRYNQNYVTYLTTDKSGVVYFKDLPPMEYYIRVAGYHPVEGNEDYPTINSNNKTNYLPEHKITKMTINTW